jgi:superfamily II DNA or RNA helicase
MLGAGRKRIPSKGIIVATVQTANNVLHVWKFKRFLEKCNILFFDEFHLNKAATAVRITKFCQAPMRFGLSGTIDEKSKVKMMHYTGLTGPVLAEIRNKELVEKGRSAKPYIRFIEVPCEEYSTYPESYQKGIVRNSKRNRTAVKEVLRYLEKDLKVLVTVVRIKHGLKLLHKLEQATDLKSEFLSGRTPLPVRERMINDFKRGRVPILVVSDVFSVGMDVPEISAWVNCAGGQGMELVLQRLGRTLRAKQKGPNKIFVTDFIDKGNKYLFRHSVKRLKLYEREDMADIKIIRREK